MADTHLGVSRLEAGDNLFLDRLVGDQATQGGATLAGGADRTEQDGSHRHVQVSAWAEDHRVVAPQLQNAAGESRSNFRRHFTSHAGAAGGADQGHTRVVHQRFAGITATDNHLAQVRRGITEVFHYALEQCLAGQRGERGLLRRLPDHRVAADQRQGGIPGPDRDREVEGTDHPHHPQWMPGLAHVVARTFGGDGQAVQLARQADGEVADVDHFLYFTQAFLSDLTGFPRHQFAQVGLVLTQYFAELAHQFTATRCRDLAPQVERMLGATDLLLDFGGTFPVHRGNLAAVDR
ncbi:hypothetical protein D3C85_741840 [compost metagenome]